MRLAKGIAYTAVAAAAIIAGADYYFDKQYERAPEQKRTARSGIEALVQGPERSKQDIAPGYIDFLAEQGYWKKMKNVELISQQLLRIEKGARSGQQTATYRVRYRDRSTGEVETNICTFDMVMKDGTWTIAGE